METLYRILLITHISFGSISLVLFWIPVFARKGGKLHNKVGIIYFYCMSLVVISAMLLCFYNLFISARYINGLALLFLSILTINPLWSGLDALKHKKQLTRRSRNIRLGLEGILFLYGILLLVIGIYYEQVLIIIFGSVGVLTGQRDLRTFLQKEPEYNWFETHMSGMIISGSAAYTAFFAFGARSLFGFLSGTYWVILPWVMPTIIALIAVNILRKSYKIKRKKVMVV